MRNQLEVSEKYSRYWPAITLGSLIVSALFLGGYIYANSALLESYLRLAAFAFFVIGFLSYFKLREGQITITYNLADEKNEMMITYSVRDQTIHEESIDLSDIKSIKVDQMPNRSLYNDFYKIDRSVRLKKKHMDGWLYLNELHGRMIPLSQENAQKIVTFIGDQIK
ncbi:hypothetical protein [Rhodohalobacter sp. 8-1]|uniref:hypothetical protein n=1 Tax=Rhodohalobacter sp. 8-1 TaxID=3131972 RepID=UPI0030EC54A1